MCKKQCSLPSGRGHQVAGGKGEHYLVKIYFVSFEPYECIIYFEKKCGLKTAYKTLHIFSFRQSFSAFVHCLSLKFFFFWILCWKIVECIFKFGEECELWSQIDLGGELVPPMNGYGNLCSLPYLNLRFLAYKMKLGILLLGLIVRSIPGKSTQNSSRVSKKL